MIEFSQNILSTSNLMEAVKSVFSYQNLVHAIAGSTGSVVAMTIFYPLDTARTRLQVDDKRKAKHSPVVMAEIAREEGLFALYRGLFPVLSTLWCSNFIYFYSYNSLKIVFLGSGVITDPMKDLTFAFIAGVINVLVTTPLWVVNTRLKLQGSSFITASYRESKQPKYSGIFDALWKIWRHEGVQVLWNGTVPSLWLATNPAIQFMVYETIKRYFQRMLNTQNEDERLISKTRNEYDEADNFEVELALAQDYVNKGYVEKLSPSQVTEKAGGWYLPHFPVVRPEKATTKTRVVFDASAKCDGVCLNDMIHQGPKLQKDLFDVLLRFRKHHVALVCDIKEMYLRIKIAPEDRPYHRFLWRDIDTEKPPDVYQFNTLVFGVNASPFLAQYVTQQLAKRYSECYPAAAETIKKSTYMDDSMDSVENTDKAIELYQQLSELWGKAIMLARKWLSNSQDVLQKIPVQDRASEVDLSKSELPNQKTLGILWIAAKDNFTFKAKDCTEEKLTKRILLSKIVTLFDPLGFLAPFIIRGKMILQEI
ncbi:hypothetical protein ScPMuIL_004422 [Solemya velum]